MLVSIGLFDKWLQQLESPLKIGLAGMISNLIQFSMRAMIKKNIQFILKTYLTTVRQQKTAGFTLLELLMAITVGGIVLYAMLSLVVSLLGTEKRETALSQTQQQMAQAMDYIGTEIQQARYIYEGECLRNVARTATADKPYCAGLARFIKFPADDVTPVLAFWKLEAVPYRTNPQGSEALPGTCADVAEDKREECYALKTTGHTYTLVVYGVREDNPGGIWDEPRRLTRYELRKYKVDELAELEQTEGYIDPQQIGFSNWPCTIPANGGNPICPALNSIAYSDAALVNLVDANIQLPEQQNCPDGYSASPHKPGTPITEPTQWNFYACVSKPDTSSGNFQDAIVYLRGNAAKKAGQPQSRAAAYLPSIERRVQARSVFNRTPPGVTP